MFPGPSPLSPPLSFPPPTPPDDHAVVSPPPASVSPPPLLPPPPPHLATIHLLPRVSTPSARTATAERVLTPAAEAPAPPSETAATRVTGGSGEEEDDGGDEDDDCEVAARREGRLSAVSIRSACFSLDVCFARDSSIADMSAIS